MNIFEKNLPINILSQEIEIEKNLKDNCINDILNSEDFYEKKTNVKAKMSKFRSHEKNKNYLSLGVKLTEKIKEIYPDDFFNPQKKDLKWMLYNFWSAIYVAGDKTITHGHLPATLSFCYYLDVTDDCSPLYFDELDFYIEPKNNLLVVFPGFLLHSVPECKNEKERRIVFAGNIWIE